MSSVFLADLDGDWIAPSQACTNPIFTDPGKASSGAEENSQNPGKMVLSMEEDSTTIVQPNLIHQTTAQNGRVKASVSLNDCLACSGCVTSAETVLITEQSNVKFFEALNNPAVSKVVVSLSPQSLASLTDSWNIPAPDLAAMLMKFFDSLGAILISDVSISSELSLLETASEFVTRFRQQITPVWTSPEVSIAYSSTRALYTDRPHQPLIETHRDSMDGYSFLPMLASSCPGFICYAEKTHPAVLPFISTAKSPQQIMGTVVKDVLAPKVGMQPSSIYHVSVMPCFDKKLEATRKDFFHEDSGLKEVDLCLTTVEVLELISDKAHEAGVEPLVYLSSFTKRSSQALEPSLPWSLSESGGVGISSIASRFTGSGGFAEFTFRFAAKELFGVELAADEPLSWKEGRNGDMREVQLEVGGEVVLRFALAYGFRNIQSVIQKMRRKNSPYHFVEIMACPGGCINGGAQIKTKNESKASINDRVGRVQKSFESINTMSAPVGSIDSIYASIGASPFSSEARRHFHTSYHAVPKMELINPEVIRW